jgi:hypothetical protein
MRHRERVSPIIRGRKGSPIVRDFRLSVEAGPRHPRRSRAAFGAAAYCPVSQSVTIRTGRGSL